MSSSPPIDVFISRKSADAALSKPLYQFLTAKGLTVFESDETLPRLGNSDYREAIDQVLDQCRHLIVVGSTIENIQSPWVKAEWGFFVNEKRAGRKSGNLLTVVTSSLQPSQLPPALRTHEVIVFNPQNFERIYAYLGSGSYIPPKLPWRLPTQWMLPGLLVLLALVLGYSYWKSQPFDLTIRARPNPTLQLKPDYPAFAGGKLILSLGSKEEEKQTLANGEVIIQQLPDSLLGKKVPVKLQANHWKSEVDSVILTKNLQLPLVPDGSLGEIDLNVQTKSESPNPIDSVSVTVNTDTTLLTNAQGLVKAQLPYKMQRDHYQLTVHKKGFKSYSFIYYPKTGSSEVRLDLQ